MQSAAAASSPRFTHSCDGYTERRCLEEWDQTLVVFHLSPLPLCSFPLRSRHKSRITLQQRSAMHTPTTAISSVAILDSDELLQRLLRSVPSAQYRSDVTPEFDIIEDELLRHPTTCKQFPRHNTHWSGDVVVKRECDEGRGASQGVFARLGALLNRFACSAGVKVEESVSRQDNVHVEQLTMSTGSDVAGDNLTGTYATAGRDADAEDTSDEMEIEFIILAEKPSVVTTSIRPSDQVKSRAHHRRNSAKQSSPRSGKTRSKSTKPPPPSTPPSIQRRRQQAMGAATEQTSPRKRKRGVPGFI